MKQLIAEIEKQTDYLVVFRNDDVDVDRIIQLKNKSGEIVAFLNEAFLDTGVRYEFQNKYIVLSKRQTDPATGLFRQSGKRITGRVTDAGGEAMPGVNVVEKGTTNGAVTDGDGNFLLEVKDNAVLQVSFIGYAGQEIEVRNRERIQITLVEDLQLLDEVVVVGYGTQKKRDLTGAISSVKLDDTPVATVSTVSHVLAGKAAGLQVSTVSAQPGGGASYRIRGAASVSAGNDPLIIIDGFPVKDPGSPTAGKYSEGTKDNILGSINPNDIESIEVLKDASSTAIYGARAANGVIIVTTKRG
ncbi:MAG: TonB-dependent receptor plug domain-containing protein, partial [Tannerellaceae bacterium]|nr:TonB-dependent receptor plug domain-containing protein [Tannerellaceae bacterium]